jgi:peptide/nickel transport system permease protein
MTGSLRATLARAWRDPGARVGAALLALLCVAAAAAPWALPDPSAMPDLLAGATPPSLAHPFGTDQLNRDLLSRVAHGGRVSLTIAALAVALSLTVGTAIGVAAGWWGGWLDAWLMRSVEAALAIPRLFVLLLLLIVWERIPVSALVLVIGLTGWFATSRLVRGEVLRLRTEGFVEAARVLGAGSGRTIFRHLVPHVLGVVLVGATLGIGEVILLEAGLSFLGLGVQPPTPSWGGMVLEARTLLAVAPWAAFFPGLAIGVTVLSVNLVSDSLRAAFDPRAA